MNIYLAIAALGVVSYSVAAPEQPWQALTDPTPQEAAALFAAPPPEYSAQFTWGWGGPVDREVIARDLDGMKALGVSAAAIEPKAGMKAPYLSPGYFDLVKVAVEEAKKRDMRLWFMDDGDYPSGLAGGKFTREKPEYRMMVLSAAAPVAVAAGEKFSRDVGPDVVTVSATNQESGAVRLLEANNGHVDWTAPAGTWDVSIVNHIYRTLPTRSANSPSGAKDTSQSLMDYLDPRATDLFRQWTFEEYQQAVGDEFGKTVLGFRGDEPAFVANPWTPRLLEEFQRRKGYDLRPYLAAIASGPAPRNMNLTPLQRRAYADYCDVWSDLYRDSYFSMEAAWCGQHGMEMQLHIEHEEILPQLANMDGDYFKDFRNIQMPGIDIIWHQIWMDNPADFPKLASSAAHLFGHPRAMCEAFAAYQPAPDVDQARWLLDFLMTRGISHFEYMFWAASVPRGTAPDGGPPPVGQRAGDSAGARTGANRASGTAAAGAPGRPAAGASGNGAAAGRSSAVAGFRPGGGTRYYKDAKFPALAAYVNRLSYLLGAGRPAAQIGLYIPTSSYWYADAPTAQQLDDSLLAIAHGLLEHQRDFDYIDEQALTTVLKPQGSTLVNLSGQGYTAIIVPPSLFISRRALDRLEKFAKAGGRVIFIGEKPPIVTERNFLSATAPAKIAWATFQEPTATLTPEVLAHLPEADVALESAAPLVSYNHRRLHGADIYFVFNSGEAAVRPKFTLSGSGAAQLWDAATGAISEMPGATSAAGHTTFTIDLPPWSTKLVVLGGSLPSATPGNKLAALSN